MYQRLVRYAVTLVLIVLSFAAVSAQTLPENVGDDTVDKAESSKTRKFDFSTLQRGSVQPFVGRAERRFSQIMPVAPPSEVIIGFGPLQLISRVNARGIGEMVYYRTYERPRLSLWGIQPTLTIRKDRYTGNYGFRAGIRMYF